MAKCQECGDRGEGRIFVSAPAPYGVQARAVPACNGQIPAGCTHAFTMTNSEDIPAGGTRDMFIGSFQPTQLVNIVQISAFASGEVEIIDLEFNKTSVLPKAESKSDDVLTQMGDMSRYTDEAARSGTTPIYKGTPLADNTNQLTIKVRNNQAVVITAGSLRYEAHMKAPELCDLLAVPDGDRAKMGKCYTEAHACALHAHRAQRDAMAVE